MLSEKDKIRWMHWWIECLVLVFGFDWFAGAEGSRHKSLPCTRPVRLAPVGGGWIQMHCKCLN
jgi:hypothetical protein